jgi:uncharacterized membrane protein (DUF4010 family)
LVNAYSDYIMDFFGLLPSRLFQFVVVTVFSLIIGLSQRQLHKTENEDHRFGTDRTFTFIGILGYLLYIFDPLQHSLFLVGVISLTVLFALHYYFKIKEFHEFGITTMTTALLTYCLGPLIVTQPLWLFLIVVVTILIITELKEKFIFFSTQFDRSEFLNLGKFLVMAGVILPIVPDKPIVSFIALTPYKIWLTVVIISSISYISYLLRRFVFPESGIILSGILGGMYSSTATTIVMSRKCNSDPPHRLQYSAAIVLATCMMYLRVLLLIAIFNSALFKLMLPFFIIMVIFSAGLGIYFIVIEKKQHIKSEKLENDTHPLEIKVALAFTLLFIAFSFITYYAINTFGKTGLNILSWIVGVTDIDPFLINLFQGKFSVPMELLGIASFQAIVSNNIIKSIYAAILGAKENRGTIIFAFLIIIVINISLLFFI